MKWCVALLALLQSLDCSGLPVYSELASMADRALGVTLTNVNSMYAVSNLYRVTRRSIIRVVPVGLNTFDLLMKFGIKETECLKSSREDPQRCAFISGFFAPSYSCSSRVRVSAELTQVVTLRCGRDSTSSSSSSSSSSEEMIGRRRQQQFIPSFVDRHPVPTAPPSVFNAPPPSGNPDRSLHREEVPVEVQPPPVNPDHPIPREEVRPRGDTFSNYLE